ncbi:MAG: FAD-dependent oxidoreductase [Firmicutes bacterium]|nr:FAD-dependent oxidoreductase [Bacillota bacterium]
MEINNYCKTLYCDVAIAGGGVAGCAAAVEAARRGKHTIVFEKGTSLGGLATNGYVPQIAGGIEGICLEFAQRLDAMGQLLKKDPSKDYYRNPTFEPEYGKIALEDMVFEAGARVIYDSTLIAAEMSDERTIKDLIFYTKGGYMKVKAKMYIDATGDGDLAALSGVPYEVGGQDFAGLSMSTTQGSRWAGADLIRYRAAEAEWKAKKKAEGDPNPASLAYTLEEEAIKRGELDRHITLRDFGLFCVMIPNTPMDNASYAMFSFHSYYCHNNDAEDITRQILEQHQQMKRFHKFLKENVPGFEKLRLVGLGNVPGVRDCRRIFGGYMLKAVDVACGSKFDDGIARFPELFDTHHPTSPDWVFMRHVHIPAPAGSAVCEEEHIGINCDARMHPFGVPAGIPARSNPRDYCDIPYRSIVPEQVDNLLCAGRCCSAEFNAQGSMRIVGPAMGTGQAAGLAVCVAIDRGVNPRELDGREIRSLLIAEGVELDKPCDGYWKEQRELEGDLVINRAMDAIMIVPKR